MANLKISQLPSVVVPTINDYMVVVNDGVTKKMTINDLKEIVSFTGNTSGDCISDIYVSNIHSCSPLNLFSEGVKLATLTVADGLKMEDNVSLKLGAGSTIVNEAGTPIVKEDGSNEQAKSGPYGNGLVLDGFVGDSLTFKKEFTGTTSGGTIFRHRENLDPGELDLYSAERSYGFGPYGSPYHDYKIIDSFNTNPNIHEYQRTISGSSTGSTFAFREMLGNEAISGVVFREREMLDPGDLVGVVFREREMLDPGKLDVFRVREMLDPGKLDLYSSERFAQDLTYTTILSGSSTGVTGTTVFERKYDLDKGVDSFTYIAARDAFVAATSTYTKTPKEHPCENPDYASQNAIACSAWSSGGNAGGGNIADSVTNSITEIDGTPIADIVLINGSSFGAANDELIKSEMIFAPLNGNLQMLKTMNLKDSLINDRYYVNTDGSFVGKDLFAGNRKVSFTTASGVEHGNIDINESFNTGSNIHEYQRTISGSSSGVTGSTKFIKSYDFNLGYKTESLNDNNNSPLYEYRIGNGSKPCRPCSDGCHEGEICENGCCVAVFSMYHEFFREGGNNMYKETSIGSNILTFENGISTTGLTGTTKFRNQFNYEDGTEVRSVIGDNNSPLYEYRIGRGNKPCRPCSDGCHEGEICENGCCVAVFSMYHEFFREGGNNMYEEIIPSVDKMIIERGISTTGVTGTSVFRKTYDYNSSRSNTKVSNDINSASFDIINHYNTESLVQTETISGSSTGVTGTTTVFQEISDLVEGIVSEVCSYNGGATKSQVSSGRKLSSNRFNDFIIPIGSTSWIDTLDGLASEYPVFNNSDVEVTSSVNGSKALYEINGLFGSGINYSIKSVSTSANIFAEYYNVNNGLETNYFGTDTEYLTQNNRFILEGEYTFRSVVSGGTAGVTGTTKFTNLKNVVSGTDEYQINDTTKFELADTYASFSVPVYTNTGIIGWGTPGTADVPSSPTDFTVGAAPGEMRMDTSGNLYIKTNLLGGQWALINASFAW